MPEVSNATAATTTTTATTATTTVTSGDANTITTTSNTTTEPTTIGQNAQNVCIGCGLLICDQFIYRVHPDMQWHENCLKCDECKCRLREDATCFIKNGKAFCKTDYAKLFLIKCDRCQQPIKKNDLVMKSKTKVFHFECFACNMCSRRLQPGDEYQLKDELLYCKEDALIASSLSSSSNTTNNALANINNSHHHHQLYLNQINMVVSSSSISLTPENSVHSGTSGSSFSPNTNSSSSSIVDSPSNYSSHNYSSQSSSSTSTSFNYAYNVSNSNTTNPNTTATTTPHISSTHPHQPLLTSLDRPLTPLQTQLPTSNTAQGRQLGFSTVDGNNNNTTRSDSVTDKDDDRSVSNDDNDDEIDENDDDDDGGVGGMGDDSISDESSLNESSNSVGMLNPKHHHGNHNKKNNFTNSKVGLKLPISGSNNHNSNLLQIKSHHHHSHHHGHSSKPARIRTVLNEKQLQTLRTVYGNNPRPDALLKEQLVEMTGLNPRVIRVWFQNKRCKDKKKNMLGPVTPVGVGGKEGQPQQQQLQHHQLNQQPSHPQQHQQPTILHPNHHHHHHHHQSYSHLNYQHLAPQMFDGAGCY